MDEHRAAMERGVKGVPLYLIGGNMYTGDVGLEEMREVVEGASGGSP